MSTNLSDLASLYKKSNNVGADAEADKAAKEAEAPETDSVLAGLEAALTAAVEEQTRKDEAHSAAARVAVEAEAARKKAQAAKGAGDVAGDDAAKEAQSRSDAAEQELLVAEAESTNAKEAVEAAQSAITTRKATKEKQAQEALQKEASENVQRHNACIQGILGSMSWGCPVEEPAAFTSKTDADTILKQLQDCTTNKELESVGQKWAVQFGLLKQVVKPRKKATSGLKKVRVDREREVAKQKEKDEAKVAMENVEKLKAEEDAAKKALVAAKSAGALHLDWVGHGHSALVSFARCSERISAGAHWLTEPFKATEDPECAKLLDRTKTTLEKWESAFPKQAGAETRVVADVSDKNGLSDVSQFVQDMVFAEGGLLCSDAVGATPKVKASASNCQFVGSLAEDCGASFEPGMLGSVRVQHSGTMKFVMAPVEGLQKQAGCPNKASEVASFLQAATEDQVKAWAAHPESGDRCIVVVGNLAPKELLFIPPGYVTLSSVVEASQPSKNVPQVRF